MTIQIRHAKWEDQDTLYDLDLKCFDDVWAKEFWLHWFQDFKVVFLAYLGDIPVGFAACEHSNEVVLIEKFGVKQQYRQHGVSRSLLLAVQLQSLNYDNHVPVHLIVPEPWLYPGPDSVADWMRKVGFTATRPLLTDYFCINGQDLDGVKCIFEEVKMALCWQCNTRVKFLEDGWVCPECGQHGKPDLIAPDWEEGRRLNAPYNGGPNAHQSSST